MVDMTGLICSTCEKPNASQARTSGIYCIECYVKTSRS